MLSRLRIGSVRPCLLWKGAVPIFGRTSTGDLPSRSEPPLVPLVMGRRSTCGNHPRAAGAAGPGGAYPQRLRSCSLCASPPAAELRLTSSVARGASVQATRRPNGRTRRTLTALLFATLRQRFAARRPVRALVPTECQLGRSGRVGPRSRSSEDRRAAAATPTPTAGCQTRHVGRVWCRHRGRFRRTRPRTRSRSLSLLHNWSCHVA
ncbi:hypothetical protein C8Q77DRAFT_257701 [Trametes polyzona]|nr:hypothetical protein C8Q77DRAFT_257701 [Trametes polyzona]